MPIIIFKQYIAACCIPFILIAMRNFVHIMRYILLKVQKIKIFNSMQYFQMKIL